MWIRLYIWQDTLPTRNIILSIWSHEWFIYHVKSFLLHPSISLFSLNFCLDRWEKKLWYTFLLSSQEEWWHKVKETCPKTSNNLDHETHELRTQIINPKLTSHKRCAHLLFFFFKKKKNSSNKSRGIYKEEQWINPLNQTKKKPQWWNRHFIDG